MSLHSRIKTTWSESLACKSLYDRVSQPEPSANVGDHGTVPRGSRAEAFTK